MTTKGPVFAHLPSLAALTEAERDLTPKLMPYSSIPGPLPLQVQMLLNTAVRNPHLSH